APEETETTASKPEAGRIKHVFLISLVSSGYQSAFATTGSTMPYLSGTLRPKGLLLTNYSVLTEPATPNRTPTVRGHPPTKATKGACPGFTESPSPATTSKAGVASGEGCVYPIEAETIAEELGVAGFTWKGYFEGMVSTTTGEPENCVHPAPEEEEKVETGG